MNMQLTPPKAAEAQRTRNTYWVAMVLMLAFLAVAVMYIYLALQTPIWQLFTLAGLMITLTITSGIGLRLNQTNQIDLGIGIMFFAVIILLPITSILIRGLGVYLGLTQLVGISLAIGLIAVKRQRVWLLASNVISAALTILLDVFGSSGRYSLPFVQVFVPIVISLGLLAFIAIFVRDFKNLNLRIKIALGILATGGIALGVLSFYTFTQSSRLVGTLSERIETTVNLLAEEQLLNTVSTEANRANQSFDSAISQVGNLANQLELLQEQKDTLGDGAYWNSREGLIRYSQGQYYNSAYTPSSVFVPSTVHIDDSVYSELNVTAYLDFSAPFVLENNPQIAAVYYTNSDGIITYYPNIRLGANLPPDYDGTQQPTFRVATPLFDSQRQPRWSFPRQDPAGTGLIISLSVPVYFKDGFKGVMTADFKLDRIADDINSIKVGSTGYAFLIDSNGHIIAMPPAGYKFLNLKPENLSVNEEPKQTVFDGGTFETQSITRRMVVGGSGIVTTNVNGTDTYIAYAPVARNAFSLAVVVPVAELNQPAVATRNEVSIQTQAALRGVVFILIALLMGAILVSFGLGQFIAAPVLRLTQTANQIVEGNLSAQAPVTSRDEVGMLAQAFNTMTSRLRESLEGLEMRVEERTAELAAANERNERRAKQFESISHVASTISSTLDLNSLLTQITTAINREFGFYHVGIFLLDTAREYAVLSAANSEGGQVMLARGHKLKVGEKGLVGFVSSTGKPRVALDTGADAVFFNNPDLPDTRSEIALPLHAGKEVIGVLDVQSKEQGAFSQEDINILSTLADQVSIAIQNARQNEETRMALAESETLSRQFIQTGWQSFTRQQKIAGIRHTGAKITILHTGNGKGGSKEPKDAGRLQTKRRGAVMSLPIKLRGEVIGVVDIQAPDNRQWDQDEIDIVNAIIERAAIAMENARLLTESQKRAAKEAKIGEVSAKIGASINMRNVLQTAVEELGRALPGSEVVIQFQGKP